MADRSTELPGLRVKIDRIVYVHDTEQLPVDTPHAFIYFISIFNLSDREVTLKGRRWVINESDGHHKVIEGDGIVGKEPVLGPGEKFSYNSYHVSHCNCRAEGSFHGIDADGAVVHVRIPAFEMNIPPQSDQPNSPS
ncbi:MAG: ApaG domain [Opitutales bacterium]